MHKSLFCVLAMFAARAGLALPIPTEGLQYQLDASVRSTMIDNDDGYVTNWSSRVGSVAMTNAAPDHLPYYDATAFGGRGGLLFGYLKNGVTNYNWLTATASTDNRSVFFVYKQYLDLTDPKNYKASTDLGTAYMWGEDRSGKSERTILSSVSKNGFFVRNQNSVDAAPCGWQRGGAWIDEVWTLPDASDLRNVYYTFADAHRIYAEATNVQSFVSAIGNAKHNMGRDAERPRNAYGAFADVLVYNRVLSDEEKAHVVRYLKLKWFDTATTWTNAGGTGRWADASNWSDGIPTAATTAILEDATVAVDGPIVAAKVVTTGCTLNLSGAAELAIPEFEGFRLDGSDAVVTLNGSGAYESATLTGVKLRKAGVDTRLVMRKMAAPQAADVEVAEGTLAAEISPYEISNLVLRLDASLPETIETNAAGLVTKWTSLEGYEFAKASWVADGMLPKYEPEANGGRGGVHFGWDPGKTFGEADSRVATGMATTNLVKFYSIVAVYDLTDPIPQKGGAYPYRYHGIVGQTSDYGCQNLAIYSFEWRGGGVPPFYYDGLECWDPDSKKIIVKDSRTNVPHVVSRWAEAENAAKGKIPVSVGCCSGCGTEDFRSRYLVGRIHEVLLYNHPLTTNEIEIVQRYLMDKWGVTPAAALTNICDQLPPMRYTLGEDGTLDCGGGNQTLVSLAGAGCVTNVRNLVVTDGVSIAGDLSVFSESFETPVLRFSALAGFFPCLSLACDWDLTATALELVSTEKMQRGPLVTSGGELTGPFASVTGLGDGKIRYRPHCVSYSCGGLVILLR